MYPETAEAPRVTEVIVQLIVASDPALAVGVSSTVTTTVSATLEHPLDDSVIIRSQYEDEFRNFIGVWQNDDFEELDGEDLVSVFENKYRVNVSGDDFDWSDYDENTEACYDELFDGLVHEWFDEVQV